MKAEVIQFPRRAVPELFRAMSDFTLSLCGWRSFYRMEGMGQCVCVYKHPIFGEVVFGGQ